MHLTINKQSCECQLGDSKRHTMRIQKYILLARLLGAVKHIWNISLIRNSYRRELLLLCYGDTYLLSQCVVVCRPGVNADLVSSRNSLGVGESVGTASAVPSLFIRGALTPLLPSEWSSEVHQEPQASPALLFSKANFIIKKIIFLKVQLVL